MYPLINSDEIVRKENHALPIEIRTQILQNAPYCTYRTLSRSSGISPASVDNILKLHRETGGLESRPQTHVRTQSKLSLKILSLIKKQLLLAKERPP
jgi:hypothetical protein